MNMQQMLAQAQKMQKEMMNKKDEINKKIFPGKSQLVEVSFNGKKEMLSIKIKDEFKSQCEDLELLEDMIKIAIKAALTSIDKEVEEKMGVYGQSLNGLM